MLYCYNGIYILCLEVSIFDGKNKLTLAKHIFVEKSDLDLV